jgi:hypothetical protein
VRADNLKHSRCNSILPVNTGDGTMRSMAEGASRNERKPHPPPPTQPSLRRLRKLACDGRFPSPAPQGELSGRQIGTKKR